jgi:hypothetical protein
MNTEKTTTAITRQRPVTTTNEFVRGMCRQSNKNNNGGNV